MRSSSNTQFFTWLAVFAAGCSSCTLEDAQPAPSQNTPNSSSPKSQERQERPRRPAIEKADCVETRLVVEGLNAPLPREGSAASLFDPALKKLSVDLLAPDAINPVAEVTPDSDGVRATLELRYNDKPITYIDRSIPDLPERQTNHLECADSLILPISVQLQSDDGAFAERWHAELTHTFPNSSDNPKKRVEPPHHIVLRTPIPLDNLQGSFKLGDPTDFEDQGVQTRTVNLEIFWSTERFTKADLRASWLSKPRKVGNGKASSVGSTSMFVYELVMP